MEWGPLRAPFGPTTWPTYVLFSFTAILLFLAGAFRPLYLANAWLEQDLSGYTHIANAFRPLYLTSIPVGYPAPHTTVPTITKNR